MYATGVGIVRETFAFDDDECYYFDGYFDDEQSAQLGKTVVTGLLMWYLGYNLMWTLAVIVLHQLMRMTFQLH